MEKRKRRITPRFSNQESKDDFDIKVFAQFLKKGVALGENYGTNQNLKTTIQKQQNQTT